MFSSWSKGTFRPMKVWGTTEKRQKLKKHQMETLGLGNLKNAVKLPEGEDLNEWLAINLVDFYNQISMLYSTITDVCTEESCPIMSAGRGYKYLWQDPGNKHSKPHEVSAPTYIGLLMDWIENQINDESLFPSMPDTPFPRNFKVIVGDIFRRLFRIYAHCYYHHLEAFQELNEVVHLNTSFKHFILFSHEFDLIPQKQLEPLKDQVKQSLGE